MSSSFTTFAGFSPKALAFFRQLSRNNERDWFAPRKEVYTELCVGPMLDLIGAINQRLGSVAVEYVASEPKRAIYRLYRDTRFSKDKTPYKTHIAAYFQRKGYARHRGPGFYVQVNHEGVGIAGGIYMVEPEEVKAIRAAIAGEPKVFEKLVSAKPLVRLMGELQGAALSRPPKGHEGSGSVHVRMKHWYYWQESEAKLALSKGLPRHFTQRIEAMLPVCEWIHEVLARAGSSEEKDNRPKRPEPMF